MQNPKMHELFAAPYSGRQPSRIGAEISLSEQKDVVPKVPSQPVSCPTKNTHGTSTAQGNLVQQRDEKFF